MSGSTQYRPTRAYAAVNKNWYRAPNGSHVRAYASEVRQSIGKVYAGPEEAWQQGWARAREDGWRVTRVTVTVDPLSSDDTP